MHTDAVHRPTPARSQPTQTSPRRNFVYSLDALQVPHVAETSAMQRSAADGDNQGLVKAVMETIYPARRPALLQMQQGMTWEGLGV